MSRLCCAQTDVIVLFFYAVSLPSCTSFKKSTFEVYTFCQLLLTKSSSSGSLTTLCSCDTSCLFFALILNFNNNKDCFEILSLSLSASLPFLNPTKLHISISPHSEASKKTCTVVLLLRKIYTLCLHSSTLHTETPPFTPPPPPPHHNILPHR